MDKTIRKQALPIGTMIQEYRITRVLGAGGFGIVYEAVSTFFDEKVAIKEFLPTQLARRAEDGTVVPLSPETETTYRWTLDRFLKEAQILWELGRPLPHPSIVRVTRFHVDRGTAYMIMDYEEGQPLSKLVEQQKSLPEQQLRELLLCLLDGLERVHAASVLHRDIKPANILIRPDGSPVLIDFGAARQELGDGGRSIVAMYSPVYAAPEQLAPDGHQGPWTDIFGLGGTLYFAVTGKPPVEASLRAMGAQHVPAAEAACRTLLATTAAEHRRGDEVAAE